MYTDSLCSACQSTFKLLCCLASQAATQVLSLCNGVLAAFPCAATLDRPRISQVKTWDWWRGCVLLGTDFSPLHALN